MNIIDFCNSNGIKWFPIILKNKKPQPIKVECFKRAKSNGDTSYTPHYIEFKTITDEILKQRQDYLPTLLNNSCDDITVKLAIDTHDIFQIDIDTPNINPAILHNWIENNDTKSCYYKSLTKSYGYHIFIKAHGFHDYIKDFTSTKNRFQFRQNYINGDGKSNEIFNDNENGIELLTGQWGYSNTNTIVENPHITIFKKNDISFFTDLLHIKKDNLNVNHNIIELKNKFDNQEIYDNMNNISQTYIDNRSHHFKIICSLLTGGYDNIARDCMYRSSNTKNKNLDVEFDNFKKSNNNSISIKTLFWYSKISNEDKYYQLLKKHRGVHLREEYKKILFSMNYITDTLNQRFLPYSILENIDLNKKTITHIKSHLGSGKTTIIKQFIKNNPSIKKIIYFAPRILFAQDIYNDLQEYDFKLYNKLKKHEYETTDRIIIQLESLWKVKKMKYDLIIIDEIESVLKQLVSKITNKNIIETYKTFEFIIQNCNTIITADAFLSNNSIEIINSIKQNSISKIIVNNFNPYKRKAIEVAGFENLIDRAVNQVNRNERIVFISLLKNSADAAVNYFKEMCPNKVIKYYYGSMNEKDKKFDNINEEWKDVDILVYTPIITCGVNYNLPTFHTLYMWISPNSCCVRDLFQASLRVRTLLNNDCYFAFNYTYNNYSKKSALVSSIFDNCEGDINIINKNLIEKQEYLIQLGIAIPKLCAWGVKNLSYYIYEDHISNTNIVANATEYFRICGYDVIPLEILPKLDECNGNIIEGLPAFNYEQISEIDFMEYRLLEKNVYDLTEAEKYIMIKYKFNQLVNHNKISDTKLNILFKCYFNKLDKLEIILDEIRNKSINNIEFHELNNKRFDLFIDTNFIQHDINNDLKKIFNFNNMVHLQYTTSDIMDNLSSISEILKKAKKIYNFRESRGNETDFKYLNSCIKHIIKNYTGLDVKAKRVSNGKGKKQFKYSVECKTGDIINEIIENDEDDEYDD